MRKRHSFAQIAGSLRQAEAGVHVAVPQTHECVAMEVAQSVRCEDVVRVLENACRPI